MERLHEGYAYLVRRRLGGQTAHPEVRVDEARRAAGQPIGQLRGEVRNVGQQAVLADWSRRSARQVVHGAARTDRHSVRQFGIITSGVDSDVVTKLGQLRRERMHVHVLTARIDAAQHREWAGVFGHHRDSHPITSFSTRSQSSRKRVSP
jgi:hypothetical protein